MGALRTTKSTKSLVLGYMVAMYMSVLLCMLSTVMLLLQSAC